MLQGNQIKNVHFIRKCSGVKVKVARNINNEVKYRYVKTLLKYSILQQCTLVFHMLPPSHASPLFIHRLSIA